MFNWLKRCNSAEISAELYQQRWEEQTLKGSELSGKKLFSEAQRCFRKAQQIAERGSAQYPQDETLLHYYALSSMNLAHVCHSRALNSETEQVLSDAHFNMTSLMLDDAKDLGIRQHARVQAEVLLKSLMRFLQQTGKTQVAHGLEEEFNRLALPLRQ